MMPRIIILLFSFVYVANACYANKTVSIELNQQVTVELNIQQAEGTDLLLVLPSEYGLQTADYQLLRTLPKNNIEVWTSNLLDAYFLENAASNLERLPANDLQKLIKAIHKKTNKNIFILTAGRGTIPVLRALASWRDTDLPESPLAEFTPDYIRGLIFMHPKLFKTTPEPGLVAELMPSVQHTNQLIYLIQPTLSPFWWNRNISIAGLEESGSDVFVQPLKNMRNRYYFRPDATPQEQQLANNYPRLIYQAIKQLKLYPIKTRALSKQFSINTEVTSVKTERTLSPYKGNKTPPELKLPSLNNSVYDLNDDLNKVVLINFWASWCPPCVHEMPSMQRLEDYFKQQRNAVFKIIAVNMAEDKKTIRDFLENKVSVNFEILLDTDGKALKQWKIFAFPTSFIIDKKGQIRYAIYGGLDWFTEDIKQKIQTLLDE